MTANHAKIIVVIGGLIGLTGFILSDNYPLLGILMVVVGFLAAGIAPIIYEETLH